MTAGVAAIAALMMVCALAPAALARGTERVGAAPATQRMNLVLPLVANIAGLDRFATAVSTPGNPMYGQYEPVSWLSRKFGASAATRRRALSFLRRHGAARVSMNGTGLFAEATMSAARAERMFRTQLAQFRTGRLAQRFTAPAGAVRIPRALRGVVTGVVGLNTKPLAQQQPLLHPDQDTNPSGYHPVSGTPSGCSDAAEVGGFTPNQYLTAYGLSTLQADGLLGQGERVALVEIDGYQESDLEQFAACFGLHVPHIEPFAVDLPKPLAPDGETELDLEVLMAAAPDLSDVDVYESQSVGNEFLRTLSQPLTAKGLTPNVMSASIGVCESALLAQVGRSGVNAGEAELAEATASGISVLASSGDSGSVDCRDSNGNYLPKLNANYPASSKWVTAVGGTNLQLNPDNTIAGQQVWNDQDALTDQDGNAMIGAGGGGFSSLFPRPNYQNGTVSQNQRALPDVAMLADSLPGYDIYCAAVPGCIPKASDPAWQPIGGTSAASPLLAGGFALIDQYLREHGKQELGFANPLLYSIGRNPSLNPSVFYDVTDGTNDVGPVLPGGGAPLGCCDAGPGFDEASGWGGVNVANLASVALNRVPKTVNVSLGVNPKQRPVAARAIFAQVKCSAACRVEAAAQVNVGRRSFSDASSVSRLTGPGHALAKILFKPAQEKVLHLALARHLRVTAKVTASIVDSRGDTVRQSATKTLTITR